MKLYKSARVWQNRLHELIGTKLPRLRDMMSEMDQEEFPDKHYKKWTRSDLILSLLDGFWPEEDGDWQMQN